MKSMNFPLECICCAVYTRKGKNDLKGGCTVCVLIHCITNVFFRHSFDVNDAHNPKVVRGFYIRFCIAVDLLLLLLLMYFCNNMLKMVKTKVCISLPQEKSSNVEASLLTNSIVPSDLVCSIKASLFCPMAGKGDKINYGTF